MKKGPVVLLNIEGFGLSASFAGNGILSADPKNIFSTWQSFPHLALNTKPERGGVDGNISVFYKQLALGKNVPSNREIVDHEIKSNKIYLNKTILDAVDYAVKHNSALHLVGHLPSKSCAEAEINHILAILHLAKSKKVYSAPVHIFIGDMLYDEAIETVMDLESKMDRVGLGEIATVCGDSLLSQKKNYVHIINAISLGRGNRVLAAKQSLTLNHKKGFSPVHMAPAVIVKKKSPVSLLSDFDSIFCYDFNPNALSTLISLLGNAGGKEARFIEKYGFFMPDKGIKTYRSAYDEKYVNYLSSLLSENDISQIYLTDENRSAVLDETFSEVVQSKLIKKNFSTLFEQSRQKSYPEITAEIIDHTLFCLDKFDFIMVSIPALFQSSRDNDFKSVVESFRVIDEKMPALVERLLDLNGTMLICSNFSAVEKMSGRNITEKTCGYTRNPVPLIYVSESSKKENKKSGFSNHFVYDILNKKGSIKDIAPTILALFEIEKPSSMEGESLLKYLRVKN